MFCGFEFFFFFFFFFFYQGFRGLLKVVFFQGGGFRHFKVSRFGVLGFQGFRVSVQS